MTNPPNNIIDLESARRKRADSPPRGRPEPCPSHDDDDERLLNTADSVCAVLSDAILAHPAYVKDIPATLATVLIRYYRDLVLPGFGLVSTTDSFVSFISRLARAFVNVVIRGEAHR